MSQTNADVTFLYACGEPETMTKMQGIQPLWTSSDSFASSIFQELLISEPCKKQGMISGWQGMNWQGFDLSPITTNCLSRVVPFPDGFIWAGVHQGIGPGICFQSQD